ncbi:hypothetical protein AMATHDRAFT_118618, partial [Amanita thiersii Skay4041]
PSVRVVVRLPYNRPDNASSDPPPIEWTPEKADILWKVIERSRSIDGGGADWKGLAAHLEVPLPYLLYRVNARFQEEIKGLKDIQGALSPTSNHNTPSKTAEQAVQLNGDKPKLAGRLSTRMIGSTRLGSSGLPSPLGVRARLNSLGHNSLRPRKATSSSTITVQAPKAPTLPPRPITPSSSEESEDSESEEVIKEEEADRKVEEQEALDRKLHDLQQMMTNESLGLVSARPRTKENGRYRRGRHMTPNSLTTSGYPHREDTLSSRSASTSQSVSSASSPQGSIPDIPSPSTNSSQNYSPMSRHMSPAKSSSPPSLSSGIATGRRYGPLSLSDHGSNHESETSSFSDISESISASALESALLSNIRGHGSRL